MVLWFLQPLRHFLKVFARDDSPKQLALGLAFGVLIGLIPKGNLTAAGLSILMLTLRVNLGSAMLSVFTVSLFSAQIDPLSHGIGARLLGNEFLFDRMSMLYDFPLVPWTSLNNTVVLGGLLLGVCLFYPTFHLSEIAFKKYYGSVKRFIWRRKAAKESEITNPKAAGRVRQPSVVVDSDPSLDFDWKNL